jgi:hypothetical protein
MAVAVTVQWRGALVEVQARPVARYLWMTVSIDVLVDGEAVLQTGGQAKLLGNYRRRFWYDGGEHTAELSWGMAAAGAFPFMLRLDGEVVLASEVPVEHWLLLQLGCPTAALLLLLVVAFLCFGLPRL